MAREINMNQLFVRFHNLRDVCNLQSGNEDGGREDLWSVSVVFMNKLV